MGSGVFSQVFSSWEVIATSLIILLFLPLVFFVAATRSRKKKPVRVPPPRSIKTVEPPPEDGETGA
jgi:hypothetical protein